MPLTAKGRKIRKSMGKTYGPEKAKQVFYASKNAGKITGVDRRLVMDSWDLVEQAFFDGTFDAAVVFDAPKQLSTRYRKGPIYHGLGVVTQGDLRKREGARSDIGGHEAKIESAEHKALNKYVPLIQSRQQLAQTRAAQGSPIKAAYHQYRAGRYGKKAQNKVNKATFKPGGEANPETGQNALAGKLNQGPLLTYRGNDN